METLIGGGSCSRFFAYRYKDKNRSFLGVRAEIRLATPILPFNHSNLSFSANPISLPHQIVQPKFLVSSLSSDTQVEVGKEELQLEEMQITDINQTKTVHVKFQLERECSFGQKFHIVGDDPIFGLWNPENAVPMNWSDGHVWSVELDIPIGKSIKFKFIMKEGAETILWQPGPDRVLETWETEKTITISEDWDNAEFQKIIEVVPSSYDQLEDSSIIINQERLINAENFVADPIILENITEAKIPEKEDEILILNEDVETQGSIVENTGRAVDVKGFSSLNSEVDTILVKDEGVPVLVPGLILPTAHADEKFKTEDEKDISSAASIGAGKAKDLNLPELDVKEEHENNSTHMQERANIMFNDEKEEYENEQQERQQLASVQDQSNTNPFNVFYDDIQWGWRTLRKFLNSLGIL